MPASNEHFSWGTITIFHLKENHWVIKVFIQHRGNFEVSVSVVLALPHIVYPFLEPPAVHCDLTGQFTVGPAKHGCAGDKRIHFKQL